MKVNTFVVRQVSTLFFALLLGLALAACQPSSKNQNDVVSIANPAELDKLLDEWVEVGAFPFLYARLEDMHGHVIYEHSAVNTDLFPGVQINGQSWVRVWSMSKIVTISLLLDLVEDGLLSLSDPVSKFIPEFAALEVAISANGEDLSRIADKSSACPLQRVPMTSTMTVLDLINHQAGFYYATTGIPCLDAPLAAADLPSAITSQALIDKLATLPLIQQPGTTDYYGTNTTVLGIVAERVTGKSLKQLVEERITGPLKIDGLQYGLAPGTRLPPTISGHGGKLRLAKPGELDIFGPSVPDYEPDHALYLGGEGMLATADGYLDFLRMLLLRGQLNDHRFLNETTVQDITAPHTQLDNPFGYNGYNLWVNNGKQANGVRGEGGLWIGGGYEGTHFWIDPKREFVGVIMTQIFATPESGWGRDEAFRNAVYAQLSEAK